MRNDAKDFAQRLYAGVPAHYRAYDEEQGQPLLSLLRLVGKQVANLRDDLDDLWDNFFIETCDDWVVPYLAALVGTKTLAHSIGQSNRLDVRNTVRWRQSKGTRVMLEALANAISGWPTELAEFFRTIGWSQNMNHVRADAVLTVDVHDPMRLGRLGHADDPWAHAADIRPSTPLDQARVSQGSLGSLGIGQAAWGTPGRHRIKNLGFFVHRLQTFAIQGATPAFAPPGRHPLVPPVVFTFDPLYRDTPLFVKKSQKPLTRAAFGAILENLEKDQDKHVAVSGIPDGYKVVAINLCNPERAELLKPGELGIDPELGRFAFSPRDPFVIQLSKLTPEQLAVELKKLTVNYVEAFSDNIGARSLKHRLDKEKPATRIVSSTGQWNAPADRSLAVVDVHTSLSQALKAAKDGDVIEIVDSVTYAEAEIDFDKPKVESLTIRAATGERPCLIFFKDDGTPTDASLRIKSPLESLELNGLWICGGPIRIDGMIRRLDVIACTLDPGSDTEASLVASDTQETSNALYYVCRSITGGLSVGPGVSRLTIADSIVDRQNNLAIGGLPLTVGVGAGGVAANVGAYGVASDGNPAQAVHLERVTVLGRVRCDVLTASECILDGRVVVNDLQAGCIRYSRFEKGSVLPRRHHCVPDEKTMAACRPTLRCLAPLFNSRRFGRPAYAQLASGCPKEIRAASEVGSEIGAFANALNTIRLANLKTKLQEFLPVGLSALILAET